MIRGYYQRNGPIAHLIGDKGGVIVLECDQAGAFEMIESRLAGIFLIGGNFKLKGNLPENQSEISVGEDDLISSDS
jgi:hypothetical protein